MDNLSSNSALQQDDNKLVLQNTIPEDFVINYPYSSLDLLDVDLLPINNSTGGSTINEKAKNKQKSSASRDGDKQKKVILRDIERQRRQEMANLCGSLRMQLPLEYVKGKRSVSDLLNQAANYITHKEKNLQELKATRDTLDNLMTNDLNSRKQSSSISFLPISVSIGSCLDGIEILISVDLRDDNFSLSQVLEVVLSEGLSVVSCFSTVAGERMLHTIHTEATNVGGVDKYELQQKLSNIVNL